MTNQLITYRLAIDYSLLTSLMSLMSSISYVWKLVMVHIATIVKVFCCLGVTEYA